MRLAGLVVALAALVDAQLPETPGANSESTTTTLHPLPFESTSSEVPILDRTTSKHAIYPETSIDAQIPDPSSTFSAVLVGQPTTKNTNLGVDETTSADSQALLGQTTSVEVPVEQPTTSTEQPPSVDPTTQLPPDIETTSSQEPPVAETTSQPSPAGEESTSVPAPDALTTSSEHSTDAEPVTTEELEEPKATTTKEENTEPTSKDEGDEPKSEGSGDEGPKTKDDTDPKPTSDKGEAPVTVPPAVVTAEPQETISGVTDNTLHSTKDSDGNDVVVPVLFGPSCLIFCEHAGKDNGPGGIVLWGIGPAPGSYILPPLPGITPAPSAVIINGGVPTPVGTQTPEDPEDPDDENKSTDKKESKTEDKTTEAKSTAESSATSTTEASTTELPQLSMGVETVVVNVDATPTTAATSSEVTSEATSTEASTETTDLPQLSMGVETVVVNVDATPTTGGTTETSAATSTETTEATTQTTELPQLSMGIDTVVVDVDATPTTGGTTETSAESATSTGETSIEASETSRSQDTTTAETTSTETTTVESTTEQSTTAGPRSTETSAQSTTFLTTTTTTGPERTYYPCVIYANPGIDPFCTCHTTVSGKGYYVSTDLISSSCADYTAFPSPIPTDAPEPKVTEKPEPEPFVKTDDGTVVSYPDRTIMYGNYPGGKYTYTKGVGDPVTLETPLPTRTDANNKGSSQCGSIDDACDRALNDGFDDETVYKDYVSRYARIKKGMVMVATFGQAGCTAQFKCDDYGIGMKGKDIKDA
ncbi:hypothetical protein IL306_012342 [Fusarium sp. DS 682]|nr:hypothetical protein IL306_012342 [Fusarium sp. DS 682]